MNRLICALVLVIVVTTAAAAQSSGDWKLVWSDEFDKDGKPDPARWTYETGFVRNQELQWYQPDNAWCEKGFLIIEGRRERVKNPRFVPGSTNWNTRVASQRSKLPLLHAGKDMIMAEYRLSPSMGRSRS